MKHDKILDIEKNLFSNIQSEFYKLNNYLKKEDYMFNNKNIYNQLYDLNSDMLKLENKIKELRITISKDTPKDTILEEEIDNHEKDKLVIERFKPLMLYYRFMMDK
jgi:hypothetical protein